MIFKKILFISLSILSLIFIYIQATNNMWKYHLESDVKTFYNRFTQFSSQGNFLNFERNEYLPGSLFFFITPRIFNNNIDYQTYLNNFILINLFLLAVHLFLYKKIFKSTIEHLPMLLFIAIGPILLYRFELFTSLMFLLSIYLFNKDKLFLSGIFIGISIMIKIYPLFIIPYFLILLFKSDRFSGFIKYIFGVTIGILIPIIFYTLLQGSIYDTLKIVIFHTDKPIMIESIYGSVKSLRQLDSSNTLPEIDVQNGVWGSDPNDLPLINFIPYFTIAIYYLILLIKIKKNSKFTAQIPISILLLFLLFSKYLNPQYLFWALSLLPLTNLNNGFKSKIFITIAILTLVLTQATYPLYFDQLLEAFNVGVPNLIFWVLQIRNMLLVVGLAILVL